MTLTIPIGLIIGTLTILYLLVAVGNVVTIAASDITTVRKWTVSSWVVIGIVAFWYQVVEALT